ncbi:MAG: hypothetical protein M3R01_02470, partial [Actinomycetota bacterium]|nr:hypothetical protein [Actinomycetota bacterium]
MVAITEEDVRELALRKPTAAPVTSCYLNVDGRQRLRHLDVSHALDLLLRPARAGANGDVSVAADLHRIEEHVRKGFERSNVAGLAMFSCSADGFWRIFALAVPVRDQLVVNHSPSVRQLETVLDEYERFGVLLADRQRARMLVFELGELVESAEAFDELPRSDDDDHSYTKDHARDHVAAKASQHLRHAARVAFSVFQDQGFDRLILGAPEEIAPELESCLHPYLRSRLEARCSVGVGASIDQIRAAALEIEAAVERRKEAELVARLKDEAGAGRKGVAGLDDTLRALVERRVETLVVSSGYVTPGWRCVACRNVARVGRECPACGGTMYEVDDVVEEAVEDALAQACRVAICRENADLDVMGRVG